jgi:uncharacterized protein YndB with AHSA1/START domain
MRVDSASRRISAPPRAIYRAFAKAGSMERWLPPSNMTGKMLHFDFRDGGSYRMRLTFRDPEKGIGKTSEDSDEVEVRFIRLEEGKRIEQEVTFESDDPAFAGLMRMVWSFQPENGATVVTVRAENVPYGISSEDHEIGLNSSLENLAAFVEGQDG